MPLPQIVMEGRLVDDPELRYTQSGKAVVNVRVVANNRIQDKVTGEWKDGDSIFLTATCWDTMAENVAECLPKGALVTLSGRLRQREWDDKEGAKHTVYEVSLDSIGPSLRWDRAQVARKVTRTAPEGAPQQSAASPWDTMPQVPVPASAAPPGPPPGPPQQSPMPGWGGAPPSQAPQYDPPPF
jgi:single-strand DNA-binding protein